jgi:hypothetical protein
MKLGLRSFTLCICLCILGLFNFMATAQGTVCAADGANPTQGSPIGCVTGDGVQVTGTATAAPAEVQPEVLPLAPEQRPAAAPVVNYQNGKLTIVAKNSTLGDILRAIAAKTGAAIDLPEAANERVVSQLGPAPARDVMAALLNGSHFNYVMVGTEADPKSVARVVLTAKREHTDSSPNSVATASAMGRPMVQPRTALQAAVMKPYEEMLRQQEEQQAQQAAAAEIQPVESTPEPSVQPAAAEAASSNVTPASSGSSEAAPVEAPPSPEAPKNANGTGEKTPQQVLQNLYETRRQMMVQQHQATTTPQQ